MISPSEPPTVTRRGEAKCSTLKLAGGEHLNFYVSAQPGFRSGNKLQANGFTDAVTHVKFVNGYVFRNKIKLINRCDQNTHDYNN